MCFCFRFLPVRAVQAGKKKTIKKLERQQIREAREGQEKWREIHSPFKGAEWRHLTPGERLRRSWQMRSRLLDPKAAHDRKLFPKP